MTLRILHLVGDFSLPRRLEVEGASGVVAAALQLARAQAAQGYTVWVVGVGPRQWSATWEGVTLRCCRRVAWARVSVGERIIDLRIHAAYISLAVRRRFDVIHGHLYYYQRFLPARLNCVHVHADPFFAGNGEAHISLTASDFQLIARTSQAQIAVSEFVARQMRRGLGAEASVHVVPNGVDHRRFDTARLRAASAELRSRWGVPADATVFLYVGAFVPEKGVLELAQAFRKLAAERPEVYLVLAGGSALWVMSFESVDPAASYEQSVRSELEDARRAGRVQFLGRVGWAELPDVYTACDVVVVPSIWQEAFGLVVLEAQAAGLPVLASRVGGIPELVTADTGVLIAPGDPEALRQGMLELSRDRGLRRRLGARGRECAVSFSWERAAACIDELYSYHLGRKGGG